MLGGGGVWLVVARRDAWLLLRRYLTIDDLKRFDEVVLEVLGDLDPKFELPPGERWLASIQGKVLKYSDRIREGLAETLAALGACDCLVGCATTEDWAARIVRRIFELPGGWRLWASLSRPPTGAPTPASSGA